ncbi:hypothetical protein JCM18882A_03740 [Brevibacterium metallidurans]|uniref:Uncharacterized protein n=2 Tax=Brevibacterium metallidurans TaxID=1482676 RepID=A0ABN0SIP4_9MICO
MAHSIAEAGVPNRYLRLPASGSVPGHNGRMRYLIALIIGIVALFVVNAFADLFSMPRPWGSLLMGGIVGVTMVITLLIWETVRPSQHDGVPAKPKMSEEERAQARAERRARLAAEAGVSPETGDGTAVGSEDSERTEADTRGEGSHGKSAASPGPSATAAPGSAAAGSAAAATGAVPAAEGKLADGSATQSADDAAVPAEDEPQPDDTATQRAADAKEAERAEADASAVDEVEPDHAREAAERESEVRDESRDDSAQGSSLESPPVGEPGVSIDALDDEKSRSESASGDEGRSH